MEDILDVLSYVKSEDLNHSNSCPHYVQRPAICSVDPRNTSKQCSRCGTLVEKSLAVRVHACPVCGLIIDRDENAAINILALGLESLGVHRRSPTALAVGE